MSGPYYREGRHVVEVLEHAFQKSTNGNWMIVFKVKVIGQVETSLPDRPIEQAANQYERNIRVVITDKEESKDYAMLKLRNAGWQGEKFEALHELHGTQCEASCEHREGTGDNSGKVFESWDFPLPMRESKPLEGMAGAEKSLNALFGKTLKNSNKPAAPKAEQKPEPAAVGAPADDEVPF